MIVNTFHTHPLLCAPRTLPRVSRLGFRVFGLVVCWLAASCGGDSKSPKVSESGTSTVETSSLPPIDRIEPVDQPQQDIPVLRSTSRVVYFSAADDPHRLQVTVGLSEYGRFLLASDPEVDGRRNLNYLMEGRAFSTPARSSTSVLLEETTTRSVRLWVHLRQHLYAWQLDEQWQVDPKDEQRKVLLLDGLGTLAAHFDGDQSTPTSLRAYHSNGALEQSLESLVWRTGQTGQPEPVSLVMASSSGPVWTEDQFEIQGGMRMLPAFFLPSDQRPPSGRTQGVREASK